MSIAQVTFQTRRGDITRSCQSCSEVFHVPPGGWYYWVAEVESEIVDSLAAQQIQLFVNEVASISWNLPAFAGIVKLRTRQISIMLEVHIGVRVLWGIG